MLNLLDHFMKFFLTELFSFGMKELRACLFAGSFLFVLLISNYIPLFGLPRYDFLFIAAIVIQVLMLVFKLETKDEAKTIFLFHIIGFALEAYKTSDMVGSWAYPEFGYIKLLGVPLYSGFMYAAVGSYIAQAWKVLKLRLVSAPPYWASIVLCVLIYVNFFTNHFTNDFRVFLIPAVFLIYFRTFVYFTPKEREYKMPLSVGFLLTAFFIWVAENLATLFGAWVYPNQTHEWQVVGFQKITSWFLLVIISFIIVAYLKHFKEERARAKENRLS